MKLVIVESPAKAKTIGKILGSGFVVESSIGHIRDLPKTAADIPAKYKTEKWSRLGVNVEKDFEPLYIVSTEKKKQVKKLQDLLKKADELYLATDEDREGEAISWHLLEVLKPKNIPVKRLAFHEITKEAIAHALAHPREVDMNLVSAQETRRVLDRLYGYEVSPILWRKIAPKLSAGRVQSVALRIIVERERARMSFKAAAYHSIMGKFTTEANEDFDAVLKTYEGQKIAIGKDFDPDTGLLSAKNTIQLSLEKAEQLAEEFKGMSFKVDSVDKKPTKSSPYAPFITSTLQQEANSKLGFSSKQAMQVAQKLYENGFITYMRTDSISLSEEAIKAARDLIKEEFGANYLPDKPRVFKSKVKNAQEAHEAIRPAGNKFRTPKSISGQLTEEEFKLYDLIYKRTLASQMKDAVLQQTVVKISSVCKKAAFQANGKVVEFDGYMRAYSANVEVSDDEEAEGNSKDVILPFMEAGEALGLKSTTIKGHETKPPARYTEASLVKELEARGIGRPSTYASIIDTILRRNYVFRSGKALVPTFVAFAVVKLLELHFTNLVDMQFTANMEEDLDAISRGEEDSVKYLKQFYFGAKDHPGITELIKAEIDPKEICTIPLESADSGIAIRIGRYGPYLERGDEKASLPDGLEPDKLNMVYADELLKTGSMAAVAESIGNHPETGEPIFVKVGRFGPYVQMGEGDTEKKIKPKMKSIPAGIEVESVDFVTAVKIINLPRKLGVFEDNQQAIMADIGRFGPYIKAGVETRSLTADKILDLTYEEAVEILKSPKPNRRGGAARTPAAPLKEFQDGKIKVLTGRYGPYVTDGKINASVPKSIDLEKMTEAEAIELIEKKK